MRAVVGCLCLFAAVLVPCATAQSRLEAGVSAGAVKLTDQRAEQALSAILEYLPYPWLSLSAIPSLLHISDQVSGRSVSSNGPGDVPVVAAASHAFATPGTPSVGAALMVVLPAGNAACGLGSGQTSLGFDVGGGGRPDRRGSTVGGRESELFRICSVIARRAAGDDAPRRGRLRHLATLDSERVDRGRRRYQ